MGKVFIIGEIGLNSNGDITLAKQLIDGAAKAGANAVKFQKRNIDVVYTKEFLDSPRESPWGTTQRAQKMGLEFGVEQYRELIEYARERKLEFFASAWDISSQLFLRQFDLRLNKIASAMLTNLKFIETVAQEGKLTFVSVGMSSWEEIDTAVEIFREYGCPIQIMHTVSTYPCENKDSNLNMIKTLQKRYKYCEGIGFSDHSKGRIISMAAVPYGITSLERHITLDKTMYGSDQAASLELPDFERLVLDVRGIEQAMGTGERILSEGELKTRKKLRGF